jgi:hypothetical protein
MPAKLVRPAVMDAPMGASMVVNTGEPVAAMRVAPRHVNVSTGVVRHVLARLARAMRERRVRHTMVENGQVDDRYLDRHGRRAVVAGPMSRDPRYWPRRLARDNRMGRRPRGGDRANDHRRERRRKQAGRDDDDSGGHSRGRGRRDLHHEQARLGGGSRPRASLMATEPQVPLKRRESQREPTLAMGRAQMKLTDEGAAGRRQRRHQDEQRSRSQPDQAAEIEPAAEDRAYRLRAGEAAQ